jgi:phage terminase large subunit
VLIPTIRKPNSEIWVSFNPHLQTDSTYQRFIASPPPDAIVTEISWRDNPWFPEELDRERIHLKSVDYEGYLHIWEGQCLAVGDNQMIGVEQAYAAAERYYKEDQYSHAPKILGVDVARYGGDRSVIFRRQGLMAFEPYVFKHVDNMSLAGHVMQHIAEWKPDAVMIDAGRGEGVIDRLRQVGHRVTEVNFGGSPVNKKYANKRAEMWDDMATWVKEKGCITRNVDLIQDLTSPTYIFSNSTNKFQVESKELIKARGGKSPDLADALALTFAFPVVPMGFSVSGQHGNYQTEYDPYKEA